MRSPPALLPALLLSLTLALTGCCGSGLARPLDESLGDAATPLLVVYYPDHATWDTPLLAADLLLDGAEVGTLCEGDVLLLPVTPGEYRLSTDRDDEWGCGKALLRPEGGWPPVTLTVGPDDPALYLRYGSERYDGPDTRASICERRLLVVDEATARRELGEPPRANR